MARPRRGAVRLVSPLVLACALLLCTAKTPQERVVFAVHDSSGHPLVDMGFHNECIVLFDPAPNATLRATLGTAPPLPSVYADASAVRYPLVLPPHQLVPGLHTLAFTLDDAVYWTGDVRVRDPRPSWRTLKWLAPGPVLVAILLAVLGVRSVRAVPVRAKAAPPQTDLDWLRAVTGPRGKKRKKK